MPGTIIGENINIFIKFLPLKLYIPKALAAGILIIIVIKVTIVDIPILLNKILKFLDLVSNAYFNPLNPNSFGITSGQLQFFEKLHRHNIIIGNRKKIAKLYILLYWKLFFYFSSIIFSFPIYYLNFFF